MPKTGRVVLEEACVLVGSVFVCATTREWAITGKMSFPDLNLVTKRNRLKTAVNCSSALRVLCTVLDVASWLGQRRMIFAVSNKNLMFHVQLACSFLNESKLTTTKYVKSSPIKKQDLLVIQRASKYEKREKALTLNNVVSQLLYVPWSALLLIHLRISLRYTYVQSGGEWRPEVPPHVLHLSKRKNDLKTLIFSQSWISLINFEFCYLISNTILRASSTLIRNKQARDGRQQRLLCEYQYMNSLIFTGRYISSENLCHRLGRIQTWPQHQQSS